MNYPNDLDRKVVKSAEITAMLDAIRTAVNTTRISTAAFEKLCVEYRSLLESPTFGLMAMADPLTIGGVAFGGWYPITNTILQHNSSHPSAPNFDGGTYPVLLVTGSVGFVGACRGGGVPTEVCLGRSVDGGATWEALDGTGGRLRTQRQLGANAGRDYPNYGSPNQTHYIFNTANYRPKNYPSEKMVDLVTAFGGTRDSAGNPTTYNAFCIMTDGQLSNSCQGWGWLTLDAREQGF